MARFPMILALGAAACTEADGGRRPRSEPTGSEPTGSEPTSPTGSTGLPTAGEPDWVAALRSAPGVTVLSFTEQSDLTRIELAFEQPVDHDRPGGPTFSQQALLRVRDVHAPLVLSTYGYSLAFQESEPSGILMGNELELEKRFDGTSRPAPADLDWALLNPAQVAADAHHVVEVLKPVFDGPWIGTGGSNGGIDALGHRMAYPDDLVGTVAYVAPLMDLEDPRTDAFFTDRADPTCQAAVEELRLALLTELREDFVGAAEARVDEYQAYGLSWSFRRVGGIERALELSMIELPFTFWQFSGLAGCPAVPDPDTDPAGAVDFGVNQWIANGPTGEDGVLAWSEAWFTEVLTYAGYPGIDVAPIADLVDPDLVGPNPDLYLPAGAPVPEFDPIAPALQAWLDAEAEDVVLVYGELDPFTTMMADVSRADDSVLRFVVPGATHLGNVAQLGIDDEALVLDAIARWTE